MKSRWFIPVVAATLLAFLCGTTTIAQDRDRQDRDRHEHHWDRNHPVFDDHEHEVVRGWWTVHREHPLIGFRDDDRLPGDWEPRLQVGFILDTDWRHRLHPLPADLYAQLPPPPPHYAYYVLGRRIVLVDRRNWHVADIINIEF